MKTSSVSYLIRRVRDSVTRHPDRYLHRVPGVIHVGANFGQERDTYAKRRLNVVWVEPIPEVFAKLRNNIVGYAHQQAFQRLLSDEAGKSVDFHVSSNEGASSSILDLHLHREVWPHVDYVRTLKLTTSTLDSLVREESLSLSNYGALVLDTQGAELLVLKGGTETLKRMHYIKAEAADFEAYRGGCVVADLTGFLEDQGFRVASMEPFAQLNSGGTYYDVLYERRTAGPH